MNTQLKKGDKCQSPWGVVTVDDTGHMGAIYGILENGKSVIVTPNDLHHLTRIPTPAERMQAVLEIAWDVENRLQDDETVQLKVGAFVEFARQFVKMRDVIEESINADNYLAGQFIESARLTEKLLKGETL